MRRFGLLGLALLFAIACDDSDERASCIEGAYEQCSCDSGATGTRLCSNGALGACVCSSVVPVPDACEGVQCDAHETCVSGSCELRPGRCDSDADCAGSSTPVCEVSTKHCIAGQEAGLCGGEVCPSHKSCVNGACVLKPGACDRDADCGDDSAPICDGDAHACVTRCHGVSCESYEACAEATGTCALQEGRCISDGDCPVDKPACNASHVCVEDLETDPCNGVSCQPHEYCLDGACVLNSGKCNSDRDCPDSTPKCDGDAHACVTRCHGVSCESHEACAEATGTCALQEGRCNSDGDCSVSAPICDAAHTCVASDPCASKSCGASATCSNVNGYAFCNCPFGQKWSSSGCVPLSEDEKVNWCSIQWVTGWDSALTPPIVTDFAVGSEQIVYAQVYVANPAGGSLTGEGKEEPTNVRAELLYTAEEVTLPLEPHRFTKVTATRNMNFSCSGETCNNNEYMAALPTDKAANLRFVFRYSRDMGTTWNYCGLLEQATTLVDSSTVDQLGTANIK